MSENGKGVPYTRRRLAGFVVLAVIFFVSLIVWWRVSAWISSHVTGDGASTWIFFVGVPIFVAYIVYRIFEEVRGD